MNELTQRARLISWIDQVGFVAVCGMALSMTVSRSLFNVLAALMMISWLLSGRFRLLPTNIQQMPALQACFLLFLWITAGLLYTSAPPELAQAHASTYHKLLLLLVIVSFLDRPQRIKKFWVAAAAGLLVLQVAYLADLWMDIPGTHSVRTQAIGVFNNYIVEGLSLCTLALVMGVFSVSARLQGNGMLASATAGLALLAAYTVLFINPGRGAQLALIFGTVSLGFFLMPPKKRWLGVFGASIVMVLIAAQSSGLANRFDMAVKEARVADTQVASSVGLRLNAWKAGTALWRESPIIGHGIGSYEHLMHTRKSADVGGCTQNPVCLQPHNQYVLLLVEQGLVGLLLFVWILGALVVPAFRCTQLIPKLSAAFAVTFAVHSAFDSGLKMGTQMFIFVIIGSALIASNRSSAHPEHRLAP